MEGKKTLNLKFINIVDPTFPKNNLGKSISKLNASRIKMGLQRIAKRMGCLYEKAVQAEMKVGNGAEMLLRGLLQMFQLTFECIGAHPPMSLILPQLQLRKKAILSSQMASYDLEDSICDFESMSINSNQSRELASSTTANFD